MNAWLKPLYHFTPVSNWMNDPNGLCFFHGKYHLFFQHNPTADVWGDIHWGHAISSDLIHWERLPIAFGPSTEKGEVHCYSGSIVIKDDKAFAFYTSIGEGERGPEHGAQQWMAQADDDMLLSWKKYEGNPIVPYEVNSGRNVTFWRDPFVWKESEHSWLAVMGGTINGNHGCILLYQSFDLFHWRFLNTLFETEEYPLLECPNFIRLQDKYVLLFSPLAQIHFVMGTLASDYRFIPEQKGILDGGSGRNGFYAPNTYMNLPDGRRIVFGWLSDKGRLGQRAIHGWAGAQSLPRELYLDSGSVKMKFAAECKNLQKKEIPDFAKMLKVKGRAMAFSCVFDAKKAGKATFLFFESNDHREKTVMTIDMEDEVVEIDRSSSTLFGKIDCSPLKQGIPLEKGAETLSVEIYLDCSIIEICINQAVMLTVRLYPSQKDAWNHTLHLQGAVLLDAKAWSIESIFEKETYEHRSC